MRGDKVEIYIHLIWTVWDREPLISPELEESLYKLTRAMIERHDATVISIGGVADHVHLLVRSASTTRVCDMVKDAKGAASRLIHQTVNGFKWRPTYAAFSVSRWDVSALAGYIANQKQHHAKGTIKAQLEQNDEVVIYDGE